MSKYAPLQRYLASISSAYVPMTFVEIEKVLGFKLPESQKYPAWWSNNPTNNVMTHAWLAAGYKTEQVDISGRKVTFRRVKSAKPTAPETPPPSPDNAQSRRHPAFGSMKGMITIMPGVDLTEPADPDWGRLAYGDEDHTDDQSGN